MNEQLKYVDRLTGHTDWVTQITTSSQTPDVLISSSRGNYGSAKKSLLGHNHFVSDVVTSSDGLFALSGSWDTTLRLWDLTYGKSTRLFEGHTKDVLSVAFSADDRQIVSASRDRTIKMWNTLGECKFTFSGHNDWVSCVRFSPNTEKPILVSCGWDKMIKVWSLTTCTLGTNLVGHSGYLNSVAVAPDGSLVASGGKDGHAMLWDLHDNRFMFTLDAGGEIKALCFSPDKYWLCVAVGSTIKIWDLQHKVLFDELKSNSLAKRNDCTCLTWSPDGQKLYAGYTDGVIRIWELFNC